MTKKIRTMKKIRTKENKVDEYEMLKKRRIEQLKLEIEKNKAELESLNN